LRKIAADRFRIGTAVDTKGLSDSNYAAVLANEFSSVTAEDVMKWGRIEGVRGSYDWSEADRLVDFAHAHGQAVYGHTLLWRGRIPSWVTEKMSADELRSAMHDFIFAAVGRYSGRVWAWDVVNEVLDENGALRDSIFLRKLGPGYIADAFRWAHEADPNAILFINEYGAEKKTVKANGLYKLVRDLQSAGVPIGGVGFQSHLSYDSHTTELKGSLARFAALGVKVAITELDVRIPLPTTAAKLQRQAAVYTGAVNACLAVPACASLTVWGFSDARSWIPRLTSGKAGAACLFDLGFSPKPAYWAVVMAMVRALGSRPPAASPIA
jgi:endo-1,4-beta-xylanase